MADPETTRFMAQPTSFVLRTGRLTPTEQAAWDGHRTDVVVDVPRSTAHTSVHPAYRFDAVASFGRRSRLVVEIGSGCGEAIVHAAADHPGTDFLGVDVYRVGLARTIADAVRAGVTNVRLVEADAVDLLATALAPASVDELWLFFPDPWPKKRHHKRRLVDATFVRLAARVLRPDGMLRIATDWQPYADRIVEVFGSADLFVHVNDGWASRFDGRPPTRFERKGLARDRVVRDLAYRRTMVNCGDVAMCW